MSAPSRIVTDDRVAKYVAGKLETTIIPPYTAIGVERAGAIVAGVVFNNKVARDIEMTVASEPGGVTRGLARAVHAYVFEQLRCLRVSITTRHKNVKGLALRLGARPEGIKRNHFGRNQHAETFGILKEDWILR